jgi:hypothetical protein
MYHSDTHDKKLNFKYGVNLKAIYTSYEGMTTEDAIVVSETTAKKKLVSYDINKVTVSINDNDILCNLYGDNNFYKSFPDLGEYVKDQILLARRRQMNESILYDGITKNLNKINFSTDTAFYCEGMIYDIDVYCNNPNLELLENSIYYKQLLKYLNKNKQYHQNIVTGLKDIIEKNTKDKYSDELAYLYKRSKDILDPNIKFKNEKSDFSNFLVTFYTIKEKPAVIGAKITNRYGGKSII